MSREHVRAFRDIPGVRLAGVCSRTRGRAEALAAEFGIPVVADSIPELHAKTGAALVVVSVPELAANAVLKACFQCDWVVLAEKPAGYDPADAEDIAAEAARKGRRAYVALNRRHYSSTRQASDRLVTDPGPRFIRIQDQQDQAAALAAGQPRQVVENWMYANSIHVVDYFAVFGRGSIVDVNPVIRWDPSNPGTVVAHLRFSSGDQGLYEGTWNGPGPWAVTVSTPAQRLEMRPLEQLGVQKKGERKLEMQPVDQWDVTFKAGFRMQAEYAVAAALGKPAGLPRLQDALDSMGIVSRIFARG